MDKLSRHEVAARLAGVIEPLGLRRGTVIFLECENDLLLELIATDPALKTYTASANFGTLSRPQPVQILGAVEPGAEKVIILGIIAKDLRLALKIRGRLKVLPAVRYATVKGSGWSYDLWKDD
jgi:hypothetical protein